MTQSLSKNVIADFSTQLAVKMAVGATTGTLASATDSDGVALPTGVYFLTIDRNNSKKEYIKCTLTGTALTSIQSISRQGALTSGCVREHRVGANVIISDFASLSKINDLLTGVTNFDSGTPLGYDGTASITTDNQLATKKYVNDEDNLIDTNIATLDAQNVKITGDQTVAGIKTFSSSPIIPTPTTSTQAANKAYADGLAIAGSPDSSTTVKGIGRVSVAPVSATIPIFVGDNDPRVPTANPATLFAPLVVGIVSPYAGSSAPSGWLLCDGSAVSRTTYSALFAITSTTYGAGDGSTTFNLPDLRNRVAVGAGTGTKVATFASRSGNVITVTGLSNVANNEFQTGVSVRYSTSGSVITGLTNNTDYFVIRTGNLTFSLATTLANAIAGTAISLSSNGTGTQTFTETFTTRAVGETGGEENHGLTATEIPAHTHDVVIGSGGNGGAAYSAGAQPAGTTTFTSTSVGGSSIHNNMQPFTVLNYIIKT